MNESHERYEELAAGYALVALEPGDEQAFLAHLPSCAACERAVAQHLETAAHMAYAPDAPELPPSVLAGIRAGVQGSGRASPPRPAPELPAPTSLDSARARRQAGRLPRGWVGVAAAAALVLSLGIWNASLRNGQSEAERRADRLAAAVQLLEGEEVPLRDEAGRPVAYAVVRDDRTVSLVVDGLAPNDASESTYVLWQTGDTGTRPVGAFDVTGNIDVVHDLPLVTSLQGWTAFAVTREPGRTAPKAPGSLPIANGPRSA